MLVCFLFIYLSCSFLLPFFSFSLSLALCRLNNMQVQNDFLKQIPRMAEITVPTNYLDWKSKQLSLPINVKSVQLTNSLGRRDRSFTTDEPHYVLVRSDDTSPRHMGITCYAFSLSDFYRCPHVAPSNKNNFRFSSKLEYTMHTICVLICFWFVTKIVCVCVCKRTKA